MNIAEAKQQIKDTVDGYLARDEAGAYLIAPVAQRPIFLLGAPGIGKTAIVSQVARELGIGLVSYSMTHHTRQSALGLPFIVEKTYGGISYQVSEYTMSEIIASVYDHIEATGHERGILFLDEINCVSETLYPSMLQFLQFKTFGRHAVPDGWIVVCAGNPPEYNKSVYDFDVVTLDRLRKVEVQPDLEAWMAYAHATGVHPAIISYLDVRQTHFYVVESTPSGKSFVTARAWDDLSRIIKLFEGQGKPVGRALIEQYLQSDEIAERFAQYYTLFTKYRSDYQVGSILEGAATDQILERAQGARFDERLALLRLILDALDGRMAETLEAEQVVSVVRDQLRAAKPALLEEGADASVVREASDGLVAQAQALVAAERANDDQVRPQRLAASRLREYLAACEQVRAFGGSAAFAVMGEHYEEDVRRLRESMQRSSLALDNAFAFVERAFADDREMAVFVAELTARPATSQFISRFGSEAYYAHNGSAVVRGGRHNLLERIGELDLEEAERAAAKARAAERGGCGACGGC